MAGEKESGTAKEKLAAFEAAMNAYLEKKAGFHPMEEPDSIGVYLTLSKSELAMLTPQEQGEAAYILEEYAGFANQQYNAARMRVDRCDHEIGKLIGKRLGTYNTYMKWEEKRMCALAEDSSAAAWNDLRFYAAAEAQRWEGVAMYVSRMAHKMDSLSKRSRDG